jgi:hypothetical protein
MIKCKWLFHKWGPWVDVMYVSEYDDPNLNKLVALQERRCSRCNLLHRERVYQ